MSNSSLIRYSILSPNCTLNRSHKIDTITIHCTAGEASARALGQMFQDKKRKASCNYAIGNDGSIALIVEEKNRSWCSSNASNDGRAITIECSSSSKSPYPINDKVYDSLIILCADICKRNGIDSLKWRGDKKLVGKVDEQNMTVHRWFTNKACPGDYIYNRLGQIAEDVNGILHPVENQNEEIKVPFLVKVGIDDLNIRTGPGTNYIPIGEHIAPGVYTIIEVKEGKGSKTGWGRLKSGSGWISLDYAKKV